MTRHLRIGIIGDHDPERLSHTATERALGHATDALDLTTEIAWLPTPSLVGAADAADERTLHGFDALWCAPGSPYRSERGAHAAIRFARENGWPFIGT